MFSEISKFLFVLTDNNCYWLVHNWISKEGLLLISNEPFLFFVSDNEEANHRHLIFTWENQCRQTRHNAPKISHEEKWNCSCERRGAGRETRQGMQEATYDSVTVSGVYSIVVTVRKQVLAHSVVNFVGSRNFYPRDDFLSIGTLWS